MERSTEEERDGAWKKDQKRGLQEKERGEEAHRKDEKGVKERKRGKGCCSRTERRGYERREKTQLIVKEPEEGEKVL